MAYVPVPKDLSKVKTKVAFNLTKRQIVCFAAALIIGLPLFFLLKDSTGTSTPFHMHSLLFWFRSALTVHKHSDDLSHPD